MKAPQKLDDRHVLTQQALDLARRPTKSFYAFSCALWAAHGEDSKILAEVEKVAGIKRRALFYLLKVGQLLSVYDVPESQAERIGWTKLQFIADHVSKSANMPDQEAIEQSLALAIQTPAHSLKAALEGVLVASEASSRSVLFRMTAEQYVEVEAALLACGAQKRGKGLIGKEEAITILARQHMRSITR